MKFFTTKSAFLIALSLVAITTGCTRKQDPMRMQRGYVYYLDGAGGGGLANWGGGVRKGLHDAGYAGEGEMFRWETGLGVLIDQTVGNSYKQRKARKLAGKIAEYHREYPNAPITIIGLSAGTAIAVFTLEALPENVKVDNVILLSGSLSATHDLTAALRRVKGKMYISTSHRDPILSVMLPLAGTADRGSGTSKTIGVEGPSLPAGASRYTRQLYADMLRVVPWKKEFARYGNRGGHTDTVKADFVARYIAPLVLTTEVAQAPAKPVVPTPDTGLVENPDYKRWARFNPGSWTILEGMKTINGQSTPFKLKVTLVSRTANRLVLQREELSADGSPKKQPLVQTLYKSAYIDPHESLPTHPLAKAEKKPDVTLSIRSGEPSGGLGSRDIRCKAGTIYVPADFPDWGSHPLVTVCYSPEIPGGIARINLTTRIGQKRVTISAKATSFWPGAKTGVKTVTFSNAN